MKNQICVHFSVEGILAQNRGYLNAYYGLKFLNLNDLVAVLIQDFIEQQNFTTGHTGQKVFLKLNRLP